MVIIICYNQTFINSEYSSYQCFIRDRQRNGGKKSSDTLCSAVLELNNVLLSVDSYFKIWCCQFLHHSLRLLSTDSDGSDDRKSSQISKMLLAQDKYHTVSAIITNYQRSRGCSWPVTLTNTYKSPFICYNYIITTHNPFITFSYHADKCLIRLN